VEVELDDFLVNLHQLASWPAEDTQIHWQPELLRLVEGNARDAAAVTSELGASGGHGRVEFPKDWSAPLTEFQRRDIKKLLGLVHGANFSVPGAGKTRVALAVFHARKMAGEVGRMLVVCPKSAFESWQVEFETCFGSSAGRVEVMDRPAVPLADIVLINYERLPDARSALINWLRAVPTLLVLDEAHRMKLGPAGAWGAICMALGAYATRRLILTGTPAPNGARDLENLFGFVWPGQGRAAVSGALTEGNLRAASLRLRPLYTRTTKRELELPPVSLTIRRVDLPPLHRALYRALIGQAQSELARGDKSFDELGKILMYLLMAADTPALLATGSSRFEPLTYRVPPLTPPPGSPLFALMRDLPQYELSPKYHEALSIIASNAALGRKTLVWSTFVRSLTSLQRLLQNFNPAIVHGGTENRESEIAKFRSDTGCMVLLSNPATLGEGISLHKVCHDAIYVDRDFAAGRFLQSLDRIHRLGLAPDVDTRVTVLVASETVDELVEQRLAAKLSFMGGILDDDAVVQLADLDEEPTTSGGMDQEDLRALVGYVTNAST
jgi:hypothetical protein